MNEETLKEAWELFIKERELPYSSNLNPWEMFKAGFIAGTKQNLNIHGVSSPVCRTFFTEETGTSATKCKFCGKESWQH